jgi:hypothetical protein
MRTPKATSDVTLPTKSGVFVDMTAKSRNKCKQVRVVLANLLGVRRTRAEPMNDQHRLLRLTAGGFDHVPAAAVNS